MSANAEDIKAGLLHLAQTNVKYKNKKTQMATTAFTALVGELNAWLENHDKTEVSSADDKKLVARVIAYDTTVAKSFIPIPNGMIGAYTKAELAPLVTAAVGPPVYTNLTENFTAKEWPDVRDDVARVLGIKDKTHLQHGANFSGSQTLQQVIANVTAKVEGQAEIARVQGLIRRHYPNYM